MSEWLDRSSILTICGDENTLDFLKYIFVKKKRIFEIGHNKLTKRKLSQSDPNLNLLSLKWIDLSLFLIFLLFVLCSSPIVCARVFATTTRLSQKIEQNTQTLTSSACGFVCCFSNRISPIVWDALRSYFDNFFCHFRTFFLSFTKAVYVFFIYHPIFLFLLYKCNY